MPKPIRHLWPWEPNPCWVPEVVQVDEIPRRVMRAFMARHVDCSIQKAERSTFESRLEGRPHLYRLTFVCGSTKVLATVYDRRVNAESEATPPVWD